MATSVNSLGLILDVLGAILLLKFGIPPKIDPQAHIYFIAEQVDEVEIAMGKRYCFWSNVAVVLLIAGFTLQLVSNYIK